MNTARHLHSGALNPAFERINEPKNAPARPQKSPPVFAPGKIRLLRESLAQIEPQAGIAGLAFYRNLFALDPSLRPLFQTSIELQARKLMESLSYTIAALEEPDKLIPVLEAMGRRHVGYGARDEHYDIVLKALLWTIAQMLGRGFSDELKVTWTEALSFVAKVMKEGAARANSPVTETPKTLS